MIEGREYCGKDLLCRIEKAASRMMYESVKQAMEIGTTEPQTQQVGVYTAFV